MDLHLIPGACATDTERAAIDAVLDATGPDSLSGPGVRHRLLPGLHAAQAAAGRITEGAVNHLATRLQVPPAEVFSVAAFYHLLDTRDAPPTVVHVCDDIACHPNGSPVLLQHLEALLGPEGQPRGDGRVTWRRSPCLGQCEHGPSALVQASGETPVRFSLNGPSAASIADLAARAVESEHLGRIVDAAASAPQTAHPRQDGLRLLKRVGLVDPGSLDDYRLHDGYAALRRALQMGPEGVLREMLDAKLVGRGGAAFPTGRKWDAVARSPVRPHYIVCNADESEPGTFKDRVLLEHDPFALIEAMTIGGFATGSEHGYIYVRGEYPLAEARLRDAIASADAHGLLGTHIMGSSFSFHLEVRRGAGAYICGEETALFNSIEGYRGEPRNKPPFPVQAGLFGKPTVINNVETLVNVLSIVLDGGRAFSHLGSAGSTGTKLFCVSGCVARPGVYEVPFGVTLGQVVTLAGGVREGGRLQAILLGGAAGTFLGPDALSMPLTFEDTRAAGATIGSGVVLVFDQTVDMSVIVRRIARFFQEESCGQCVPCRIGTTRQAEALDRLLGTTTMARDQLEWSRLEEIGQAMRDASICGLGQTASSAVLSGITQLGLRLGGHRK